MIYGTVDYSNELMSEASMKVPAFSITNNSTPDDPARSIGSIDTAGIGELDAARKLNARSPGMDAANAFARIVNQYAGKLSSEIALALLERTLDMQSVDPKDMLASYAETYKGTSLGDLANLRLAHRLTRDGDAKAALELCGPIADAEKGFEREALYDAGSLLWYRLNDQVAGQKYFRVLIEKYPKDPLAASALATLGEWTPEKQMAKPTTKEVTPTEYSIGQPYPNPFNPSTRIDFSLPEAGNVSLVVYDVLGRQVAVLARDLYAAGTHSVRWNGTSVASGVYCARLSVTNSIGGVLFDKVAKLLLTK